MQRNNTKCTHRIATAASLVVLLSVAACSSSGNNREDSVPADIQARQAALDAREKELEQQASALAARESSLVTGGKGSSSGLMKAGAEMLPPQARAGECYTRVWQPPVYKTETGQRLVSEAGERIEVIPATYGKMNKRVLVQEAATRIETTPATYKTITERVMVQPEQAISEQVPPVYETVSERVIDKPAHTTWKKGTGPIQRIDDTTGEIMCLVEVPATYRTVTKQVLKTPARTRTRTVPAKYKTVQKRVVDQPARTRTVEIPAKYSTVTVVEETRAAQQRRVPIPAKYEKSTSRKLVSDGQMQWREILCETNTTPDRVSRIQTALKNAGFNPGPIDGTLGSGTMNAVNAFQRAKGLPVDKYLNVATVKALGVTTR